VSPYRIASFVIIVATIVAAASARARAAEANPFAHTDVVSLFARLPGTVVVPRFEDEPQTYESKRFDISGLPDQTHTTTGRLKDGSWVLISGLDGASLVYRWAVGHAIPVGVLHQNLETDTIGIEGGTIVERARVYSPVGPCAPGALLIRRFVIRNGVLHESERETNPPHFATTVRAPLPTRAFDDEMFVQALADRTPGLYRICDHGHTSMFRGNGTSRFYEGENIDVYGHPDAEGSVRFSSGPARLVAVPFSSGGSGGVFTAAVYRIDTSHPILVRTLQANGHMMLRANGDTLEMFSPVYGPHDTGESASHYDMRAFRYDPRSRGFMTVGTHRYAAADVHSPTDRYAPRSIADNASFPFDGTDLDALFSHLPGTTVEGSADGFGNLYYSSKRYGFYGRPDVTGTVSRTLADGTHVLLVPFDSGFDVMIFRRFANHTIPVDSLVGPNDVAETVTVERGAIVQRFEPETSGASAIPKRVTVTYALRDGRLVETSRLETAPVRPTSSPIASP
jgi:hypothetical protein